MPRSSGMSICTICRRAEAAYVNDRIVFKLKVTAQGYKGLNLPVSLYEKGKDVPLETKNVPLEPGAKTVEVQFGHRADRGGREDLRRSCPGTGGRN